jgi:hypothetical protein
MSGFSNYFLQRPRVRATFAVVVMVTVASFLIVQFTEQDQGLGVKGRLTGGWCRVCAHTFRPLVLAPRWRWRVRPGWI